MCLACPVCVIVTTIVTLHVGKLMIINMVISKALHHMLFWVILRTLCPTWHVSQLPSSIHTTQQPSHMSPHWLCHTHLIPGTVRNGAFPVSYCSSFLSYYPIWPTTIYNIHTETGLPRGITSLTSVSSVITTVTSNGECPAQVLLLSLTDENSGLC